MRYREIPQTVEALKPCLSLAARIVAFLAKNPKSTVAGLAAIAGAFFPAYTAQIAAVAAGVGLILAADAQPMEKK